MFVGVIVPGTSVFEASTRRNHKGWVVLGNQRVVPIRVAVEHVASGGSIERCDVELDAFFVAVRGQEVHLDIGVHHTASPFGVLGVSRDFDVFVSHLSAPDAICDLAIGDGVGVVVGDEVGSGVGVEVGVIVGSTDGVGVGGDVGE